MPTKRGGVKQNNPSKKGFLPVLDMINNPTSVVSLLTYSSLSGFIFTLTVNEGDEEYKALRDARFVEPVLSYIMKFAIITAEDGEVLPSYKGVVKSTESPDTFYSEAKIQQNAWKRSIIGDKEPICPPVANFSMFNNYHAKNLLNILLNKTAGNPSKVEENLIFTYLRQILEDNLQEDDGTPIDCELGAIIMPTVTNATTIGTYISNSSIPTGLKNQSMVHLASNAMRLFIDSGVVHFDLHPNNALIYTHYGVIKTLIIDFGRSSDVMDEKRDDFLSAPEKDDLREKKSEYFNEVLSLKYQGSPWTPTNKIEYVKKVMGELTATDKRVNHALYSDHYALPGNANKYQMYWYEKLKTMDPLLEESFELLKSSVISSGDKLQASTINSYIRSGYILALNKPVVHYYSEVSTRSLITIRVRSRKVTTPFDEGDCGEYSCIIAGLKKSMKRLKKMKKTGKRKGTGKTKRRTG